MKKINSILAISAIVVLILGFVSNPVYDAEQKKSPDATIGLKIGNKAPELKFKDPTGKEIALSSLQGKMVLIDFWAAWCRPCRAENPNVVKTYNKYKESKFKNAKGFTVYGVSLDANIQKWKQAIEKDGLIWESHVSDLKAWNSKAAGIYQVRAIPTNFLIDGDGIIVAKGLRGPNLTNTLEKFLK